jgi:hypothetical protein
MKFAGQVACMGLLEVRRILVGKPEGNGPPLGRRRLRWEGNIKMDLREIGSRCGLDSPGSGQGSVADFCKNGDELPVSVK